MSILIGWLSLLLMTSNQIVIDGDFDEWSIQTNRESWSIDGNIDSRSISLLIQAPGPPSVLQQLEQPLKIGIDLDNDKKTGAPVRGMQGCEVVFEMSPLRNGRRSGGVAAVSWSPQGIRLEQSPYIYGFVMAPTTASRVHEMRIDRTQLPPIEGAARIILQPQAGTVIERTIPLSESSIQDTSKKTIPQKPHGAYRVMSWNVEYGGILKRTDAARTILQALKPDILLLQEIEHAQSAEDLISFLNSINDGDAWTLDINRDTGNLRSAVATRLPAKMIAEFDAVSRSDNKDRAIRTAALLIDLDRSNRLLAVSAHLKCCGGLNGKEDMARISETLSIREAVEDASHAHRPDGLVIGGDLNLVASPLPLDILRVDGQSMLGPDSTGDLQVAEPLHLDGRNAYTWFDADSSYTPGKLDFILTGGGLKQVGSFILDCADVDLDVHRSLSVATTELASDHLPVILDVMPVN